MKDRPLLTIPTPLDPGFQPAVMFNRRYLAAAKASGNAVPLVIGLERDNGLVSRFETIVRPDAGPETLRYVERLVKFLLWARGGWKLYFGGPKPVGEFIRKAYSARGSRKFDCGMMAQAYGKRFCVVLTAPGKVPANKETRAAGGGYLKGCRIGFDLGASVCKVAAVIDGRPVFIEDAPWDPQNQSNPEYHYHHLSAALHRAAARLPRVDAIGGSSAGIIVDNEIRVASLFRAVPRKLYPKAAGLFKRIQAEWQVPVVVMNDGDVAALEGAMSLACKGVLGISMGSSQAGGFVDRKGQVAGWLSELAFVPVDYNPRAADDEWSGDNGVGASYFSQQAADKLLPAAGIRLPRNMGIPGRFKEVMYLVARGDVRARRIFETIGVYLGYTIPHYAQFYDFGHILVMGGVTAGTGGDIVIGKAREVLKLEFPEIARRVTLHLPDEKARRVGQAIAAASLAPINR
jgi:predicted NBD/HSP70 family sugar kinase